MLELTFFLLLGCNMFVSTECFELYSQRIKNFAVSGVSPQLSPVTRYKNDNSSSSLAVSKSSSVCSASAILNPSPITISTMPSSSYHSPCSGASSVVTVGFKRIEASFGVHSSSCYNEQQQSAPAPMCHGDGIVGLHGSGNGAAIWAGVSDDDAAATSAVGYDISSANGGGIA